MKATTKLAATAVGAAVVAWLVVRDALPKLGGTDATTEDVTGESADGVSNDRPFRRYL